MGFALAHAEQAPSHHLERRGLEGDREPAGDARLSLEAPRGQVRVERCLERRDELRKRIERHAGHIQEC
jgi:hypothetical protein